MKLQYARGTISVFVSKKVLRGPVPAAVVHVRQAVGPLTVPVRHRLLVFLAADVDVGVEDAVPGSDAEREPHGG